MEKFAVRKDRRLKKNRARVGEMTQPAKCLPCRQGDLGWITSTEKVRSVAYAGNHGAGELETRESLGLTGHPVWSV